MYFYLGLTITALILLVEHWFPWPKKPGYLERYAMGCGAIYIGLLIWLGPQQQWILLLQLLAFYLISGAVTTGAYYHDHASNLRQKLRSYECNEQS